jgi:hypothetical protein
VDVTIDGGVLTARICNPNVEESSSEPSPPGQLAST